MASDAHRHASFKAVLALRNDTVDVKLAAVLVNVLGLRHPAFGASVTVSGADIGLDEEAYRRIRSQPVSWFRMSHFATNSFRWPLCPFFPVSLMRFRGLRPRSPRGT